MNSVNRRKMKLKLFEDWGSYCFYCEIPLTVETADVEHFVPRKRGGKNVYENYRPACSLCNSYKGTKTFAEWRAILAERVKSERRKYFRKRDYFERILFRIQKYEN